MPPSPIRTLPLPAPPTDARNGTSPSTSVSFASNVAGTITSGVSRGVGPAVSSTATGASPTGVTWIDTVAGADVDVPSLTVYVKLAAPLKSGFGTNRITP